VSSIGVKGGRKLNLGNGKLGGETGCHRLQSMAAASLKASIGGRGGIDWNWAVGLETGAGCVGRLWLWVV
jgi:hypothetical protein